MRESGQRKDRFREPIHNSSNAEQEGNAAAVRAAAGQLRRRTALRRGHLSPARRRAPNAGLALRSAPPAWPPGRFLPAPGAAGEPGLTPRPGTAGRAQPGSAEPRGKKRRRRRGTAPSVRLPCPGPAAPRCSAAIRRFGRGKKSRGRLPLSQSSAGARPHTAPHRPALRPRPAPRSPRVRSTRGGRSGTRFTSAAAPPPTPSAPPPPRLRSPQSARAQLTPAALADLVLGGAVPAAGAASAPPPARAPTLSAAAPFSVPELRPLTDQGRCPSPPDPL